MGSYCFMKRATMAPIGIKIAHPNMFKIPWLLLKLVTEELVVRL